MRCRSFAPSATPFGSLVADEVEEQQLRRAVQLRVREFTKAEHLDLGVAAHG